MSAEDLSKVNSLLDALFLELLNLIEQHTECRVKIERLSNSGHLLLAKTRYNRGSQAITVAQIPTENSEEFKALCLVEEDSCQDAVCGKRKHLSRHKTDKANGFIDPLNWFSVLAPMTLRNASDQYKKCVDLVVEAANIQTELLAVMNRIERLKLLKMQLH